MTALHVLIALMLVIPLIAVTYAADAREGGGGGREPWSSLSEEVEVWSQPAASGNAKWQRHETLTEVAAMLRGRGLRRSSTGDDDDDHRHHTAKKIWPLQLSVEEEEDPPHPFGGRDIGSAEFRANVARRQMESCNRECGINPPPPAGIERRIAGGQPVDHFTSIPWVVAITVRAKFGEKESECYAETVANCTGAIVGPRTILSTSHCFLLPDICKAGKTVLVPLATIRVTILRGHPNSTAFNVVNITLPGYDLHKLEEDTPPPPPIVSHDLAVLTLDSLLPLGKLLRPICISHEVELMETPDLGKLLVLVGYGRSSPSALKGHSKEMPRYEYVEYHPSMECSAFETAVAKDPRHRVGTTRPRNSYTPRFMCGRGFTGGGAHGDSGGPLKTWINGRSFLVGLLSSNVDAKTTENAPTFPIDTYVNLDFYCDDIAQIAYENGDNVQCHRRPTDLVNGVELLDRQCPPSVWWGSAAPPKSKPHQPNGGK